MKVYFDWDIFQQQEYGGVSRYIISLSRYLSKNDVSVLILGLLYKNKYNKDTAA